MLLQVKGLIQIIVKFRTEKNIYMHVSIIHQISFWGAQNIEHQILGSKILSEKGLNKWKFIFLYRKINCHVLQIAKVHISYAIWFMISEKKYYELRGKRFFMVVVPHMYIPKFSANNKAYKKICTRISNSFSP